MTEPIGTNNSVGVLLGSLTVILCNVFSSMNLSEWYVVKFQTRTSKYPFGGEGPTPYYYETADLYSMVNLIWGLLFLIVLILVVRTLIRKKRKQTVILFITSLCLLLGMFIHGQIGVS